jgi:CRP-like cAMP-binding protein
MDQKLKKQLYLESGVEMSDELFDRFIGSMTEIRLKNREILIAAGKVDTSLYVQKDGLIRACYFDGENEKTYGFSNPGTMLISYHSFFMGRPSFFQFDSCGETVMLRMSKKDVEDLVDRSHEFAKWLLSIRAGQLYANEFKLSIITGSARERYSALIKNRPEVIARVPVKIVASYLGVTPNYLSYLKRLCYEGDKSLHRNP